MRRTAIMLSHILIVTCLVPATAGEASAVAHSDLWPTVHHARALNPAIEARIDALLRRMTDEDKVGQLIQVDIASITPEDVRQFKVGAILNGGDSAPGGARLAPPASWLHQADAFWDAAMGRHDGRPAIPLIWGTDAVHGDNKIVGATLFPHNIGLGAARDPDLIRRIGQITASETAATGLDWSFGPTLAVVQDDRWGRTYESFSEEPSVVASYAGPMVEGLQGVPGTPDFESPGHVIATAKHFLGDGGTGGRDQGDTRVPEATLIGVHSAGYPPAIGAGVLTVMASFSSWQGEKMHGNASLLTGVLKGRMSFDGLVVGDWNAHAQLPGCTAEHCPAAINAGLDMFMASGDWRALWRNTLADVRAGVIAAARLDDAVRRILRVKMLSGAFEHGRPSSRPIAGHFELLGSDDHRAMARQAVRESLVLLKNEGGVLPLRPDAHILVAGRGADSIAQQCGGWTLSWQGTTSTNADFPHAQSVWGGIAQAVSAAGGHPVLAVDGHFDEKPDAAIVVFGETPYAEFMGDRPTLEYSSDDKTDVGLLRRLHAAGVPVIAVFLSGRPLWVNAELNASDAFVAAFLPGSEGGGVADVLFRAPDGHARDFTGQLSFSWPRRPDQFTLNRRDSPYDPLFAFGYGLSYAHPGHVGTLDETRPPGLPAAPGPLFGRGRVADGAALEIADAHSPAIRVAGATASTGGLAVTPIDRRAQEDARRLAWSGAAAAELRITADEPLDLTRETNGELSLVAELRIDRAPNGPVELAMLGSTGKRAAVPVAGAMRAAAPGTWTTLAVPLRCFAARGLDPARVGMPFVLAASSPLTVDLSDVRIASAPTPKQCGAP